MKTRFLVMALFALASALASADKLKYTVTDKGEKVGTLEEETTGDDSSGYVDESTWVFTKDGESMKIHEIGHYGKDGIISSKTVEFTTEGHERKVKAALGDDGAKLTIWVGDDRDEKEVPLASKTDRADPTNFWFKGVKPDVNAKITYQAFDMQELTWSDVTLTYAGKKTVKVGGKDVEANEIDRVEGDDASTVYVDDKGDALLVIDNDLRIERDTP